MTRILINLFALFLLSNISVDAFNPLISQIQTYLREMQIDTGDIDGVYGPKTKAAIIKYQKLTSLKADGLADKNLLISMRRYYALYTDNKYSTDYYQDNYAYNYNHDSRRYASNYNSKCQRSLNELSSYSNDTARYTHASPEFIQYDARWESFSPRYNKRNTRITQKVNKLDRLMRRVKHNCEKQQYTQNYYQPRYINRTNRRAINRPTRKRYKTTMYNNSPFLTEVENKSFRYYR